MAAALFRAARPLHPVREDEPRGRADRARETVRPREQHQGPPQAARHAARRRVHAPQARRRGRAAAPRRERAKLRAEIGDPWTRIEAAERAQAAIFLPYTFLEDAAGFNSRLFRYARAARACGGRAAEAERGAAARIPRRRVAELEQQIGAAVPIYPELEELTLSFSLERMREWLGPDDPIVRKLLATESPDSLAALARRRARSSAIRPSGCASGAAVLPPSTRRADPMIVLARDVDPEARRAAQAPRGRGRRDHRGRRRSDREGALRGVRHERLSGCDVHAASEPGHRPGLGRERHGRRSVHAARPTVRARDGPAAVRGAGVAGRKSRSALDPATPFNLSTNNDIVGGNSGSPLIDANGRIVGLIFDGNIHSISGSYWFDTAKNRAVAVDTAVIREALTKVYKADRLACGDRPHSLTAARAGEGPASIVARAERRPSSVDTMRGSLEQSTHGQPRRRRHREGSRPREGAGARAHGALCSRTRYTRCASTTHAAAPRSATRSAQSSSRTPRSVCCTTSSNARPRGCATRATCSISTRCPPRSSQDSAPAHDRPPPDSPREARRRARAVRARASVSEPPRCRATRRSRSRCV